MKTTIRSILVVLIIFSLSIIAGCSKRQTTYSGFLGEYPVFKEGPKGGADLVYIKENIDFSKYNKVMMDHVVFWFKKDADYKGIHPDKIVELSDAFHKAVIDALGDTYPLVEEPGPDVLRIRVALTDIVPSKPALNTITTILPVGLAISTIKKGATGKHSNVGEASMEAEFLDSQSNERLAAAVDTKEGRKLQGITKWGAAEGAFKFWAERLRAWLDEQHERK